MSDGDPVTVTGVTASTKSVPLPMSIGLHAVVSLHFVPSALPSNPTYGRPRQSVCAL